MNSTMLGDVIRSILMAVGGVLVTKGYLDNGSLTAIVGGAAAAASAIWSYVSHKNAPTA